MTALNRSQFPPQGWQFFSPQTGWHAPTPKSSTFDQTVQLIIRHRQANPAAVAKHSLATDTASVQVELENYTRARLGMTPMLSPANPANVPKTQAPSALASLSGRAVGVVADIKRIAAGTAVLFDWEQSGLPPVAMEVAEARAMLCDGCPKNDQGKNFTEFFTMPVADGIRKRLERLNDLNLKTSRHDKLKVCQGCLCPLPLKVFCPPEIILKRLKPEQKADLDPRCWILKLASS